MLPSLLIAGYGRSGTTAVMNLLATDPQVVFDRAYPFENAQLSYYAKLASVLEREKPDERFTSEDICEFEDSAFGPCPWGTHDGAKRSDWLRIFWELFSVAATRNNPHAKLYSEKAPFWLPAFARPVIACSTVYLFRDPRDVWLSSNAFMRKRHYYSFHRSPADSDIDHARNLAVQQLNYLENFHRDARRADCIRLRYEDLVLRPEEFLRWLQDKGLNPDLDRAFEHLNSHRTSADLVSSVERWRREEIPVQISSFFHKHLGQEMEALGYTVESADLCPAVGFQALAAQPNNSAHGRVEIGEGAMAIDVIGSDFFVFLPSVPFSADQVHEIWVSAAGGTGDHFSLYWRDANSKLSEECAIHVDYIPSPHWRVIRFRVSQHPLWRGTIKELRLDLFNARSVGNQGLGYVRWVRLIS